MWVIWKTKESLIVLEMRSSTILVIAISDLVNIPI